MCGTFSEGCTQSLGSTGESHDPLVAITFPVGSYLAESMAAHLSCLEWIVLWIVLVRPSILGCGKYYGECLFCASGLGGIY